MVVHPSANSAACCLSSEILRVLVFPTIHGPHHFYGLQIKRKYFLKISFGLMLTYLMFPCLCRVTLVGEGGFPLGSYKLVAGPNRGVMPCPPRLVGNKEKWRKCLWTRPRIEKNEKNAVIIFTFNLNHSYILLLSPLKTTIEDWYKSRGHLGFVNKDLQ